MRIKLTLLRTAADPADLAVTVDGTATVADLARAIAETDPVPSFLSDQELRDLTLRVHGTPGTDDRSTRLLLPEDSAAEVVRSGSTVSLDTGDGGSARRSRAPLKGWSSTLKPSGQSQRDHEQPP